jgi:hypothetical protein
MKKKYINPQTIISITQCEMLVAASRLDTSKDSQDIIPSDEDYNDEFTAKEFIFSDDF